MKLLYTSIFILLASLLLSCAAGREETTKTHDDVQEILETRKAKDFRGTGPLGARTNPVKADGMEGIREYIANLKGPKGEPIQAEEIGSGGVGPFGGLLYIWEIKIESVENYDPVQIFFDNSFEGYTEPNAPPQLSKRP